VRIAGGTCVDAAMFTNALSNTICTLHASDLSANITTTPQNIRKEFNAANYAP
jgi:hypothetical protein